MQAFGELGKQGRRGGRIDLIVVVCAPGGEPGVTSIHGQQGSMAMGCVMHAQSGLHRSRHWRHVISFWVERGLARYRCHTANCPPVRSIGIKYAADGDVGY